MITLRAATPNEVDLAYKFVDEARTYQRAQGFVQWSDNSPNRETVCADIAAGKGYLLLDDGAPFGYVYIDFDGEPAYERLEAGAWTCALPYAAVHRVAFGTGARGKGASRDLFRLVRALCAERGVHVIRIDTHRENQLMQHILGREGFVFCGVVRYGAEERIAFELQFE